RARQPFRERSAIMPRMRIHSLSRLALLLAACGATGALAAGPLTEDTFRKSMGIAPTVRMAYRDLDCKTVAFAGFADAMHQPGAHADVDRAVDGSALTMTVRLKGNPSCPSPYPPVSALPPFDLRDLAGKRVTSASLAGKPVLISFFFSTCMPCILD